MSLIIVVGEFHTEALAEQELLNNCSPPGCWVREDGQNCRSDRC